MEQTMPAITSSRGARNQQAAGAGEYFVVAELNKRGAFAGNMPEIDLMACNQDQNRICCTDTAMMHLLPSLFSTAS
jgi:hypothetical protein